MDADRRDWNHVGSMAEPAARLAELVPCRPCNGTSYATGCCPDRRRDRDDEAAHAACETCGGTGRERA